MLQLSYNDIITKIKTEKGLSEDEIKDRIKDKLNRLTDLVSKEGAAHIVANELGVKLFDSLNRREVKISRLIAGMRSVVVSGKVLKLYKVISFTKGGREGKVASFLIGDETGRVRIVLWDANIIKLMEDGSLKEDSIVKIQNGYVKNNNGFTEVNLGSQGQLVLNPEGVKIENVKESTGMNFVRKQLKDLTDNDAAGVLGTIIQIFEPRFYDVCTQCNKKVNVENGKTVCKEHGEVSKTDACVVNFSLDDGTGTIRCVAFRETAENILGKSTLDLKSVNFEELKKNILGKQILASGRVNKNEAFDRIEFKISKVEDADPQQIAEEMAKVIQIDV